MKTLTFILISTLLLTSTADAKIIERDEREVLGSSACKTMDFTIARLLVKDFQAKIHLSTATAFQVGNSAPFFVTTAHSIFKEGNLRGKVKEMRVEVVVVDEDGECRLRSANVEKISTGTPRPRKSFYGASRDIALLEISPSFASKNKIKPLQLDSSAKTTENTATLHGFAWEISDGLEPFKTTCDLKKKSPESEYPEMTFQHHDCDTSKGSSGSILLGKNNLGNHIPLAVHAVGWGRSGMKYGDGVYNIAVPLDFQLITTLLSNLRK